MTKQEISLWLIIIDHYDESGLGSSSVEGTYENYAERKIRHIRMRMEGRRAVANPDASENRQWIVDYASIYRAQEPFRFHQDYESARLVNQIWGPTHFIKAPAYARGLMRFTFHYNHQGSIYLENTITLPAPVIKNFVALDQPSFPS